MPIRTNRPAMVGIRTVQITAQPNYRIASIGMRPSNFAISIETTVKKGSSSTDENEAPIRPNRIAEWSAG